MRIVVDGKIIDDAKTFKRVGDGKPPKRKTGTPTMFGSTNLTPSLDCCTKWANGHLEEAGVEPMVDIVESFKTGVALARLLEKLAPEIGPIPVKQNVPFKELYIYNLTACFQAIDKLEIPHQGICPRDFLNGYKKLVIAFVWRLITIYDLPRSSKEIIKWYAHKVKPFGFVIDLGDPCAGSTPGVPFQALVESQRKCTYDIAALQGSDPAVAADTAFDILQKEWEVEPLLQGKDVASGALEEDSLIAYLKKVKEAFDKEHFDVVPESLIYLGNPWIFAPNEQIRKKLPTIRPVGAENLEFVIEPALPEGLKCDKSTGIISGIPDETALGPSADFTVTATNTAGSVSCGISIMIQEIEPTELVFDVERVLFTVGVEQDALLPWVEPEDIDVKFEIEPALHKGLTFDPETGGISGIAEEYDDVLEKLSTVHKVTASNSGGSISTDITVEVQHAAPTALEYEDCNLCVGQALECAAPTVTAADCIVVYSVVGDVVLPDGLSLDAKTGIVSGTPTAPTDALANWFSKSAPVIMPTQVTIKAANSGGEVSSSLSIVILDAPPTSLAYSGPVVATAEVGVISGGEAPTVEPVDIPISFDIEPELPNGLEFDAATGAITGTPDESAVGEHTYSVTVSNSGGFISTELSLVVNDVPPSGLNYGGDNNLSILLESPVDFTPEYNGKGTFTVSPELPAGLVLREDGVISGTVTDNDYYNTNSKHVVTLKNSGGETSAEITFFFNDPTRELFEFIDAHEAEYIKDLTDCIAVESATNGDGCEKADEAFKWLDDFVGQLIKKSKTPIDIEDLHDSIKGIFFHPATEDASILCVYGHMDVEVPDATSAFVLGEGDSPFGTVMNGCGVLDSKGPLVAWLSTANAYCALGRALPVGLKFVIDTTGLSSSSVALKSDPVRSWLQGVDHVCVAESNWLTKDKPCVTYGLRGAMTFSVNVKGGSKDLDSAFGNNVNQVMTDIAAAMNAVAQTEGLEGLVTQADTDYDGITFDMDDYREELGIVGKLPHSDKSSCLNAWWAHPAVSVHGVQFSAPQVPANLISEYKMPSEASFTFNVWTAYGMDSSKVTELVTKQVNDIFTNSTNESNIAVDCQVEPFLGDFSDANYTAASDAVQQVYGSQPDMIRSGGTLAAAVTLQEMTKKSVCILPIGASMNPTGPESLRKKCFTDGIKVYGTYMEALCPQQQ